jgi:hypothetical protein
LQSILENCRLAGSTPLRFVSENTIDEAVVNYYSQTYEFEVYLSDMLPDIATTTGEFEKLNIYGALTKRQ